MISNRGKDETIDFFDMQWNRQKFTGLGKPHKPHDSQYIPCPVSFKKMIDSVKKLSREMPFVRVDFYEVKGIPYFGEITFYPATGFGYFEPDLWNYEFGKMIDLNISGEI